MTGHSTVKTAKKFDNIYPKEGEPWTSITIEEMKIKGLVEKEGQFFHKKFPLLKVEYNQDLKSYCLMYENTLLKEIKYMYQIDNMFHGFTDRWLGYI